jgi:hypothetical protein
MEHAYTFVVAFEDGTVINEYEGDTHVHVWQHVTDKAKTSKVKSVAMIPHREGLEVVVLQPSFGPWSPVFFRRNYVPVGHQQLQAPVTCIGFSKRYAGMTVESLVFVFDDGSKVLTDNRKLV